jgi:hypothetical protein
MRMKTRELGVTSAAVAIGLLMAVLDVAARPAAETFTATATAKTAAGGASTKVTIRIDKFVSDADRQKLLAVVKGNNTAATHKALAAMPNIGTIQLGKQPPTPIKYAYAAPSGHGRIITVITAKAILHLGGSLPDAKPKAGYDLALALLVLDEQDKGDGELAPAAKVKMNDAGAIVTDDYGSEAVRLTGIAKSSAS